jgi:hypothetical protein
MAARNVDDDDDGGEPLSGTGNWKEVQERPTAREGMTCVDRNQEDSLGLKSTKCSIAIVTSWD